MKNSKKGFSLIVALIILVLMATILTLALSLSSKTVKQTTDIFLKAQAELYARSATEYALLAISGHQINATKKCLKKIDLDLQNHEANITIMYIGNNLPCDISFELADNLITPESNVTVIIDTIVSTKDGVSDEPIRIHRRTIQKP